MLCLDIIQSFSMLKPECGYSNHWALKDYYPHWMQTLSQLEDAVKAV
jgi:hypothetical protein